MVARDYKGMFQTEVPFVTESRVEYSCVFIYIRVRITTMDSQDVGIIAIIITITITWNVVRFQALDQRFLRRRAASPSPAKPWILSRSTCIKT